MEKEHKIILESSYKPQKEFAQDIEKLGYTYDPELSSMETKVFYNPQTNEPSIVYRGSVTASNWVSNINRLLNKKDKSLDEALDVARKTQKKYGSTPSLYGHSRGGATSEYVSDIIKAPKTITYNKAIISPLDIFKKTRKEQIDYRTSNDLVSLPSVLQRGKKKTITIPKTNFLEAHGFKYI